MRRLARLPGLFLVAALLLTAGCSFNYMYRQLDWLVIWYIDDYIELDDSQEGELEQRVLRQLNWHCRTQLPRYARWFRSLQSDPEAFDRRKLERHYQQIRQFWHELMERVAEDAAQILVTATERQVDELLRNLERSNREIEREYRELNAEERQQRRRERTVRLLERWLGALSVEQKHKVEAWSEALGEVSVDAWINNRRRWQQQLVAAIRERKDINHLSARLHHLLIEPEQLWSERYRLEFLRRKALTLDMLAAIALQMTPMQRAHLDHQLLSWAEDFESLACRTEQRGGRE